MTELRDVIVVGAGPAGLHAARLMAAEGLDVVVLEEHSHIGMPTHCTGLVSEEIFGVTKIPEDLVIARPSACSVISPGGVRFEFPNPGEQLFVLDRAGFDQTLADQATQAGASLWMGWKVEHVEVSRDRVEVQCANRERVRARALVLACGVTYRFHHLMDSSLPTPMLHTAQIEVDAPPHLIGKGLELHLGHRIASHGFAWLVPVRRSGRERVKAGIVLRGDARTQLSRFLRCCGVGDYTAIAQEGLVRRLLPFGPCGRSYGPRMVAIGDAAGLTKPVTGGGIYYSLLSAGIGASTLIEALRIGDLGARQLSRYEARWRERLLPEIRAAGWFRRLIVSLSDDELENLLAVLGAESIRAVIHRTARFNWHRPVVMALLRQPRVRRTLVRALFTEVGTLGMG